MTPEEFTDGVVDAVYGSAWRSTLKVIADPPGRQPDDRLVEFSRWYSGLSALDRQMVTRVIQAGADAAVFGFLCVIDGVRPLAVASDQLRLEVAGRDGQVLLNNPPAAVLHDLYRAQVDPLGGDVNRDTIA